MKKLFLVAIILFALITANAQGTVSKYSYYSTGTVDKVQEYHKSITIVMFNMGKEENTILYNVKKDNFYLLRRASETEVVMYNDVKGLQYEATDKKKRIIVTAIEDMLVIVYPEEDVVITYYKSKPVDYVEELE